jgi:hypothetical protein
MADDWLRLSEEDRREVLNVAASASGRPPHLLEKDVWVVWTLGALFGAPLGERLVFARLDEAGFAARAIADRSVADAVAAHKSWFFAEKDGDRQTIDYRAAVSGGLRLVPKGASREALAEDYERMVEDGLLLDEAEPFDDLMARMEDLEARANAGAAAGGAGE